MWYDADEAPETLWHYTNLAGLLGILHNEEIWLTDANYLNDTREMHEALDIISGILEEGASTEPGGMPDAQRIVRDWMFSSGDRPMLTLPDRGPYIASFCAEGDLLAQWRNYAGEGGYAIGFSSRELGRVARRVGGTLVRVDYQADREKLDPSGVGTYSSGGGQPATLEPRADVIVRYKNPAFAAEQEWRLVISKEKVPTSSLDFRAGIAGITPFTTCSLPKQTVTNVRLGPGGNGSLRLRATKQLLEQANYEATVDLSRAPFRG